MPTEEVGLRLTLKERAKVARGLEDTKDDLQDVADAADDVEAAGKRAARGLAAATSKRFSRGFAAIESGAKRASHWVGRGLNAAGKVGGAALLGLGGAAAVAGGAAIGMGVSTAAGMQTAKIGFTTMLGSAEKADAFLRQLADFAATTPFEFPDLQQASSSLISAGIDADKVIPIMRSLGDVTAGMGTGAEGVQRATVALQQMSAAGKITGEDLNQLRDAGIPVFDLLSAAMGKSKKEIAELAQKGGLGADALSAMMKALETGKGLERFSGLMDKQSRSLTGAWSTLSDAFNMGMAKVLQPLIPILTTLAIKSAGWVTDGLDPMAAGLERGVKIGKRFFHAYQNNGLDGVARQLTNMTGLDFSAGLDKGRVVLDDIGTIITDIVLPAFQDASDFVGPAVMAIVSPLTQMDNVLGFVADHAEFFRGVLTGLVVGFLAIRAATLVWTAAQIALNIALAANPIGLIIAGIAALVGGFVLAYNKVDWFRGAVDAVWNGVLKPFGSWLSGPLLRFLAKVGSWFLKMGRFGLMAFRWLLTAAFRTFDGILAAAEAGLGWVPKLGDKIRSARASFDRFGNATISKLKGLEGKLRDAENAANNLAKDRSATISINTIYTTRRVNEGTGMGPELRAAGGPVTAGRPYIVGEHRPELFVPTTNGVILPKVPDVPDLSNLDMSIGPGAGGAMIVQVVLPDGTVLAETVSDAWDDAEARL